MAIGLVGRKAGMTRVFTDAGETVPVTVIEVLPNRVAQVKAQDKDGYRAVQVTYGTRRPQLYSKAVAGHYARANVAPGKALVEFRLTGADKTELKAGAEIKADLFKEGEAVDVTGTTIGKGFAGTMKRHNFAGGMAFHRAREALADGRAGDIHRFAGTMKRHNFAGGMASHGKVVTFH